MSDIEKATSSLETQHRGTPVVQSPKVANPAPLGLFSVASTTLLISFYHVNTRHVSTPNVVVGMGLFSGGLAQFMAGMWEFPRGNTFGATTLTSYGAFWMSYATILIPGSGVAAAYASADEFSQAIGVYLITWFILTFLFFIGALRRNVGLAAMFLFLSLTFLTLGIGAFNGQEVMTETGGVLGIITAIITYYCGLSDLLVKGESWFTLPMGVVPQGDCEDQG